LGDAGTLFFPQNFNSLGKIIESENDVEFGEVLSAAEQVGKLHGEIREELGKLKKVEATENDLDVEKKVKEQLDQVIVPALRGAREKMRGIHSQMGGEEAKAYVLLKIGAAIHSYEYVKTDIESVSLLKFYVFSGCGFMRILFRNSDFVSIFCTNILKSDPKIRKPEIEIWENPIRCSSLSSIWTHTFLCMKNIRILLLKNLYYKILYINTY
jgi:hypothetical protein